MITKKKIFKLIASSIGSGFAMWVVGGLYHNLILPAVNEQIHAHHEGLGITLIAYCILGFFMSYFYLDSKDTKDSWSKGLKVGILIGIVWVFPHGLTLAAVHESSIGYQFTNTLYHIVEQGIGGIIVFLFCRNNKLMLNQLQ